MNIDSLNKQELQGMLKKLKTLDNLKKSLGSRGVLLFKNLLSWEKTYLVEYSTSLDEAFVSSKASLVYKKWFNLDIDPGKINFKQNPNIKSWIRVFVDDKMIDLSLDRIEKILN